MIATNEPTPKHEEAVQDEGCACCGRPAGGDGLVSLVCHRLIGVCPTCLDWLSRQARAQELAAGRSRWERLARLRRLYGRKELRAAYRRAAAKVRRRVARE